MPTCIWCEQRPVVALSWETYLTIAPRPGFCESCQSKLDGLCGKRLCQGCGRDLDQVDLAFQRDSVCLDCQTWEGAEWGTHLQQNRSVYIYNSFLKEVLTRFKFRGDALLIQGFKKEVRRAYNKHYKKALAIPIPLSKEREIERTFNQATLVAACVNAPVVQALIRVDQHQKQSKKSRLERVGRAEKDNPFQAILNYKNQIKDRDIVLVDDIYTTGTTVRLAAQALAPLTPKSISSFTLARS